MFYPIIKSIHLLCACIGYLVYDVFVFKLLKKGRSEAEFIKLKRELLKASALILGASFLLSEWRDFSEFLFKRRVFNLGEFFLAKPHSKLA